MFGEHDVFDEWKKWHKVLTKDPSKLISNVSLRLHSVHFEDTKHLFQTVKECVIINPAQLFCIQSQIDSLQKCAKFLGFVNVCVVVDFVVSNRFIKMPVWQFVISRMWYDCSIADLILIHQCDALVLFWLFYFLQRI